RLPARGPGSPGSARASPFRLRFGFGGPQVALLAARVPRPCLHQEFVRRDQPPRQRKNDGRARRRGAEHDAAARLQRQGEGGPTAPPAERAAADRDVTTPRASWPAALVTSMLAAGSMAPMATPSTANAAMNGISSENSAATPSDAAAAPDAARMAGLSQLRRFWNSAPAR